MRLGRAISILMAHEDRGARLQADLDAFNAPSECWHDVSRGECRRFRIVRKHACAVAGVKNLKALRKAVKRACPTWDRYNHHRIGLGCL